MIRKELLELADRLEAAETLGADLSVQALLALRESFPTEAAEGQIASEIVTSSDAMVEMVNAALPGWYFSIHGRARHTQGAWKCSLRRSDVLDDDEILGTGEARSLSLAMLVAVIRVAALRQGQGKL